MINDQIVTGTHAYQGYYGHLRVPLLKLLDDNAPRRVLDVGCGQGATLREIKRRFPSVFTTGVELRPDAAEAAITQGAVDRVVVGDICDAEVAAQLESSYDIVILSHVLEHMAQPGRALELLADRMTPSGFALIGLPNVRHFTVLREVLWQGDFKYQEDGILDRTHLRFFTRRSAERLISECGFVVDAVASEVSGRTTTAVHKLLLGHGSEFLAYAFNFRVKLA